MAEAVHDFIEHIERAHATLGRIERTLEEQTDCLRRIGDAQVVVVQQMSRLAAARAARALAFDHVSNRLMRIGRRLELTH